MTLRIGRVAFGDDERTRVGSVTVSGDTLSLNGEIKAVDQAKASAEMQRINGLIEGRDEPVVPLTWPDGPPDVSGFYRVTGGRVDGVGNYMSNGRAGFDLQLTRVSGFAAPMFEDRVIGGTLPGTVGSVDAWMALPESARGFEIGTDLTPLMRTRTAEGGDLTVFTTSAGTELFDATPSFFLEPEDWYVGAATLEVGGELAIGRQVRNTPSDWRISNGLIRVTASGALATLTRYSADDAGWQADARELTPYRTVSGTDYALDEPHTITALRNSPEAVSIRLTYDAASATPGSRFAVNIDLTVRRGSQWVDIRLHTRGFYFWRIRISDWGTTFEGDAGFAPTYAGSRSFWNDGWQAMVANGYTFAASSTDGIVTSGAATTDMRCGVGWYDPDSVDDQPTTLGAHWSAQQTERVNAVVR